MRPHAHARAAMHAGASACARHTSSRERLNKCPPLISPSISSNARSVTRPPSCWKLTSTTTSPITALSSFTWGQGVGCGPQGGRLGAAPRASPAARAPPPARAPRPPARPATSASMTVISPMSYGGTSPPPPPTSAAGPDAAAAAASRAARAASSVSRSRGAHTPRSAAAAAGPASRHTSMSPSHRKVRSGTLPKVRRVDGVGRERAGGERAHPCGDAVAAGSGGGRGHGRRDERVGARGHRRRPRARRRRRRRLAAGRALGAAAAAARLLRGRGARRSSAAAAAAAALSAAVATTSARRGHACTRTRRPCSRSGRPTLGRPAPTAAPAAPRESAFAAAACGGAVQARARRELRGSDRLCSGDRGKHMKAGAAGTRHSPLQPPGGVPTSANRHASGCAQPLTFTGNPLFRAPRNSADLGPRCARPAPAPHHRPAGPPIGRPQQVPAPGSGRWREQP